MERNSLGIRSVGREASGPPSPPNLLPNPLLGRFVEDVDDLSREISAGDAGHGGDGDPALDSNAIRLPRSSVSGMREIRLSNVRHLCPPP
jgi:hypothetical protein